MHHFFFFFYNLKYAFVFGLHCLSSLLYIVQGGREYVEEVALAEKTNTEAPCSHLYMVVVAPWYGQSFQQLTDTSRKSFRGFNKVQILVRGVNFQHNNGLSLICAQMENGPKVIKQAYTKGLASCSAEKQISRRRINTFARHFIFSQSLSCNPFSDLVTQPRLPRSLEKFLVGPIYFNINS